jgi:hypothetical protein
MLQLNMPFRYKKGALRPLFRFNEFQLVRADAMEVPIAVHHMAVMQAHHAVMVSMHPMVMMMVVVMMTPVMRGGRLNAGEHETHYCKH